MCKGPPRGGAESRHAGAASPGSKAICCDPCVCPEVELRAGTVGEAAGTAAGAFIAVAVFTARRTAPKKLARASTAVSRTLAGSGSGGHGVAVLVRTTSSTPLSGVTSFFGGGSAEGVGIKLQFLEVSGVTFLHGECSPIETSSTAAPSTEAVRGDGAMPSRFSALAARRGAGNAVG